MDILRKFLLCFFAAMILFLSFTDIDRADAAVCGYLYEAGEFASYQIEVMELIKKAVSEHSEENIDISEYDLKFDEFEYLYGTVMLNEPGFFYASNYSTNIQLDDEERVISFSPVYIYSRNRAVRMQKEIDKYIDDLKYGIDRKWSDAEKILYVHDHLAERIEYYRGGDVYKGRNIYEAMIGESAVCVGYALSFQYIMDVLDIPCICITSESHIWNMVKIGESWYHVDLTWDDSHFSDSNTFFHNIVLCSEQELQSGDNRHDEWTFGMQAGSEKYDSIFWKNAYGTMSYYKGIWYYISNEGLCSYDAKKDKTKLLFKISESWLADSENIWTVSFGKTQLYEGNIYFNSRDKVYKYNTSTKRVSISVKPDIPEEYQISDIAIADSRLYVYYTDDFDDLRKNVLKYTLPASKKDSSGFTAKDNGSTITFSWAQKKGVSEYIVYRYDFSSKKMYKICSTSKTSITIRKNSKYTSDCVYMVRIKKNNVLKNYSGWIYAS